MSKQIPRSPAEIERQAREFAAMREAIAQYSGGVNKIPTGKRVTKEPRENKPKTLVSYGEAALEQFEFEAGCDGARRTVARRS
jgi:hypothetical protein